MDQTIKQQDLYEELTDESTITDIGKYDNYLSSTEALSLYLNEIARYPVLTPAEEQELAKKIASGDNLAKEKFINSNLRLVVSIAKRYRTEKIDFLDLIQEGNLGLMKAVEMFDYTKGYKFSTYATWWIQKPLKAIANKEDIDTVSLHTPISFESDSELGDFIKDTNLTPEEIIIKSSKKEALEALITSSNLTEIEEQVIKMLFDFEHNELTTLKSVAKKLGKKKERLQVIESKAMRKLRFTAKYKNKNEFFM